MSYYRKTIVPNIEAHYENLSAVEKNIADFFISNEEDMDFSSRHISSMLYVSEASLSRFAKKCGYKGYREFVFKYKESFGEKDHQITGQMREVFDSYQELLNKSYNLADSVFTVLSRHIVYYFLSSLITEIHVNIGHRYTFRI